MHTSYMHTYVNPYTPHGDTYIDMYIHDPCMNLEYHNEDMIIL